MLFDIQIVHVRKSHRWVVSNVRCDAGVVNVYDTFYNAVTDATVLVIVRLMSSLNYFH